MNNNYAKKHSLLLPLFMAFSGLMYGQTSTTFSYTGAMESFTVPSCVTSITVDARGSKGSDYTAITPNDPGGLGGRVTCVYPVTPGQVLNIFVGGIPYNGGGTVLGTNGARGGGASDIRIGGTALTDRVIVAGGGGGGGDNCGGTVEPGGMGGGLIGGSGWQCGQQTGANGKGGTQTAGGATTSNATNPGTPGALGVGGNAGSTYGGSGGGGYYGGGGAAYGGGGGGSSYTDASATSVVHTQGFQNGTGQIILSYISTPALTMASTSVCPGSSVTLSAGTGSGTTYNWSNGATTASISVSPTITTNYSVSATNSCGTSSAAVTVTVGSLPSVSVPSSTTICSGNTVSLNASGSAVSSYSWNTGATTAGISVSPTVTTSYTVTGTGACGTASSAVNVSVHTTPSVTAVSSVTNICVGDAVVLTASGNPGMSYSWNTGATTASISVSPATSTIYTVTASNACGSTSTTVSQVVSICTGLNTLVVAEQILLYPNPASDLLNVRIPAGLTASHASVELTDAIGRVVMREVLTKDINTLNLSKIEQGIYFYQIMADEKAVQSGRIIKH